MVEDLIGSFWETRAIATKHFQLVDTLTIWYNKMPLLDESLEDRCLIFF